MNPLFWKREHQVALLCAIAIGAFIGTIVMAYQVQACVRPFQGSRQLYFLGIGWSSFLGACWFTIVFWPVAGAIVGAGMVYIRQLLRS